MKIGAIFRDNFRLYKIVAAFEQKGKKKKIVTKPLGEHILKHTMINLEHISASEALERIMDICGIEQDDKFQIRISFNSYAQPKRRRS